MDKLMNLVRQYGERCYEQAYAEFQCSLTREKKAAAKQELLLEQIERAATEFALRAAEVVQ